MKIGVFGDLHGKESKGIIDDFNYRRVDLILANGDFVSIENRDIKGILEEIISNSNSKVVVIPGDHEEVGEWNLAIRELKKEYDNIVENHKKRFEFKGYNIISYGGGSVKPSYALDTFLRNPIFDISELAILVKDRDNIILQLHEPPKYYGDIACFYRYGRSISSAPCEDKNAIKKHVGDEQLTYFVEGKFSPIPRLVVAGHIHEGEDTRELKTRKQTKEAYNLFVNPGAAMDGKYAIVEVDDSKTKVIL